MDTIYDFLSRNIKQEISLPYSIWAKVDSVDDSKKTCKVTPKIGGPQLTKVQLSGILSPSSGVWVVPQVGSQVAVSFTDRNHGYITMVSKIDEINVENSDYSFVINENGITLHGNNENGGVTFNDGSNGGLIIIADLITKLNNLESTFNDHAHAGVTTGSGVSSTASASGHSVTQTQASDIENPNIKH